MDVDATTMETSSDVATDRERLGRGRGRRRRHQHNHQRHHRRAPRRSTSRRRARKMVVRGLPASLTRESFVEALERDGFHANEAFEWMDYVAGRRRRDGGETTTTTSLSRFYAVVRDGRTVQRMIDAYHGTTFRVRARDEDGNAIGEDEEAAETTTASVERAPSEWTPETYGAVFGTLGTPESAGTIEEDEEYVSFVKALEREREEGRTTAPATPRMESTTTTTRKSTALLEYIWKKRAQEQRATTGGGKKKSSGKKKSKSSKSKREGKSTTRLDDEPVAADAAPKRKQKPKAKSKKKSTSSTPTTTTTTTTTATTTTTKVLKRPSSIPTPRA